MSEYVIIVAGGVGTRMNSDIPKQFLLLKGLPILMHTISVFKNYPITLVLPQDQHGYWQELCVQFDFRVTHDVVAGGKSRFQSVTNGLANISDEGLVAIHDGVRPFISQDIIKTSFKLAKEYGNAVTSISLKDSIRLISDNTSKAVDRSKYQLVQTPQTFNIAQIKKAYATKESKLFTDDASVLENDGHLIQLVEGSSRNIKITTPNDLQIAEAMIQ